MNGRILITRPREEAQEFARELQALGFETLTEPVINIVPLDFKAPDLAGYGGLIFTSANAVRIFAAETSARAIRVYAVGNQTRAAAAAAGYHNIITGPGDAEALVHTIAGTVVAGAGPLLHVRGEEVAVPVHERLAAQGVPSDTRIVYRAVPAESFSSQTLESFENSKIQVVTFFSRRTAGHFLDIAAKSGVFKGFSGIKALCISPAVLECIQPARWAETHASAQPDRQGMIELVRRTCA
jgi:uroporphyrinogen-III synthase